MVMHRIGPCRSEEMETLIAALDNEFIHSRGRQLSLAQRFSALWRTPERFLVMRDDERIVSALAMREFRWITPERSWNAVMIGMIWTHPASRGRGCSTQLLRAAADKVRSAGCDFAVLWTTSPAIYSRLGWIALDCGCLARSMGTPGTASGETLDERSIARIEALREGLAGERVERGRDAYCRLLPPAERLDVFLEPHGYAIAGVKGTTAFVLDLAAAEEALPQLWKRMQSSYQELYVNERLGSSAERWLSGHAGLEFREQQLAVWLPLAKDMQEAQLRRWYIPFIDRT
jgi:GNAT superfamily N-acetyltransferase